MRVLLLALVVLLFLGGCASSTAPKPAKKSVNVVNVRGIKIGADVLRYRQGDIRWLFKANAVAFGKEMKGLISALELGEYVKVNSGQVVAGVRNIDDEELNYDHKDVYISSFRYNPQHKYYVVGGNYVFFDKVARVKRDFAFIIKTLDDSTKILEAFLGPPGSSLSYISPNGNFALLRSRNKAKLINLVDKYAYNVPKTKYPVSKHWERSVKASQQNHYVAIKLEEEKSRRLGIALYDMHKNKIIKTFDFQTRGKVDTNKLAFAFSQDERFFIYKGPGKKFQVYDIGLSKVVDEFGQDKDWITASYIVALDGMVLASFRGRLNNDYEKKAYIYDIDKRAVLCTPDATFNETDPYWRDENTLHVIKNRILHHVYTLEKDSCIKVRDDYLSSVDNPISLHPFLKDDTYYTFKKGQFAKHAAFKSIKIDTKKVHIVKSLENAKRLMDAGFDEKAFAELKKLLNNDTSYFEDYYGEVTDTLFVRRNIKYAQEAYFNALAFNTYVQQGKTRENSAFERAAKNYAFFATLLEFKEVLPAFIAAYQTVTGPNPSALQQDMLAIYKAMYLFETNKDAAAYDLLFAANPIEPEAKKNVVSMSAFNSGLFKDRHKVAVALGMEVDEFNEPVGYEFLENESDVPYFYDLGGKKLKRGEAPTSVQVAPVRDEIIIESEYIPLD